MAIHLLRDLEKLKKEILLLGSLVEQALDKSIVALFDRRPPLAEEVKRGDREVDQREIRVEEECLKILALHQPVANDLRFVVAIMKVNNDLERVGDLAGNLAERAMDLAAQEPISFPDEIVAMSQIVPRMLRESLDSLLRLDIELARKVLREDDQIDDYHRSLYQVTEDRMRAEPQHLRKLIQQLSVSRYFERIADAATNIAEDVVFLVEGEVVRHRSW
jgi:phosphate transport system protein